MVEADRFTDHLHGIVNIELVNLDEHIIERRIPGIGAKEAFCPLPARRIDLFEPGLCFAMTDPFAIHQISHPPIEIGDDPYF